MTALLFVNNNIKGCCYIHFYILS